MDLVPSPEPAGASPGVVQTAATGSLPGEPPAGVHGAGLGLDFSEPKTLLRGVIKPFIKMQPNSFPREITASS